MNGDAIGIKPKIRHRLTESRSVRSTEPVFHRLNHSVLQRIQPFLSTSRPEEESNQKSGGLGGDQVLDNGADP